MCDTCDIAEAIEAKGVDPELLDKFALKIQEVVTEQVSEHLTNLHELMIGALLVQTGATEIRIQGRKVREVSNKVESGRFKIVGEETEDREEFVYTLVEDASKPEAPEEDEFSALLRALFEG